MRPGLADRIVSRSDVPLYGEVTASFWSRTDAMHFAGCAVVDDHIADAVVITAAAEGEAETVIGVFRSGARSNVTAGPVGRRFTDAGWGAIYRSRG